jgi:hypothetical protein
MSCRRSARIRARAGRLCQRSVECGRLRGTDPVAQWHQPVPPVGCGAHSHQSSLCELLSDSPVNDLETTVTVPVEVLTIYFLVDLPRIRQWLSDGANAARGSNARSSTLYFHPIGLSMTYLPSVARPLFYGCWLGSADGRGRRDVEAAGRTKHGPWQSGEDHSLRWILQLNRIREWTWAGPAARLRGEPPIAGPAVAGNEACHTATHRRPVGRMMKFPFTMKSSLLCSRCHYVEPTLNELLYSMGNYPRRRHRLYHENYSEV